ncbi:MAG TPA: hypothetical protein VL337_00065 [Acidimicrobiales bacterium]|nr:hypothetical protein [Acidimicrobiales bacterium]
MTLVLLVLAGIWAAVLIPPALRSRAEGRPGDSIHNFKRQLTVLRRTGPHRGGFGSSGRTAGGEHWYRPHAATPLVPVHGPVRSTARATGSYRVAPVAPLAARPATAASASRSRTIRRRRDVLTALVVAVFGTLLLGLIPAFHILLIAHVVSDVLLVAYVALLVHQRNAAAERDMKVRFLPQAHRLDPALLRAEPALLRRSAN